MRTSIIYILLVCFATVSYAQQETIDIIEKSNKAVDTTKYYSVNIEINTVAGEEKAEIIESQKCFIVKNNNNKYLKIGDIINITNNDENVMIDNEDKEIVYSKSTQQAPLLSFNDIYNKLKPYLKKMYHVEDGNLIKIYCAYNVSIGVMFEKTELHIDKSSFLPIKLTIYPSDPVILNDNSSSKKMRLEVNYTNWNSLLNEELKNLSNLNSYIITKGSEVLPSKAYSNYDVVNLN